MERSWLHRALFDNLLLKLVSLALALLIFVSVRAEKQSLAYGTVSVSFTAPPGRVLVSEPPDELQVSVLGPTSRIPRFRFEDIADVNIDLSSVPAGFLKFRPDMILLPPEFSVASIRPGGFRVEYAELMTRDVPVHVTVEGQVAAGYRIAAVKAVPASFSVSGPEDAMKGLVDVRTRPVAVEGARASIVARVTLLPLSGRISLRAREQQVEATVEIVPVTSKVVLTGIPVAVDGPDARGAEVVPPRVDVTVSGPPEVLANFAKNAVRAHVQPDGATGETSHAPRIEGLPEGVVVRRLSPAQVLVRWPRRARGAPRRSPKPAEP